MTTEGNQNDLLQQCLQCTPHVMSIAKDKRLTIKHSNLCKPTHIYILGIFHHPE